jgi:hypothetical protein
MVRWIYWPPGELVKRRDTHSPFHKRDRTPLRLTLYLPDGPTPDTAESRAVSLILALSRHDEHLRVTPANSTDVPRVEISATSVSSALWPVLPVTITYADSITHTGVSAAEFEREVEALTWRSTHAGSSDAPDAIREVLLQLAAHRGTRNDLIVTNSCILLRLRDDPRLRAVNIVRPEEATKIIGLLFRHRDTIALRNCIYDGRWGFYLALGKVRVPELDRYWSACVYSEPQRKDDLIRLGQSLNVRLHRALELRDEIGCQFYQRHTNYTRDYTMAFLDYWALMISGALDAMARMTIRAYALSSLVEKSANFRDLNFPIHLEKAGARELADILKDGKNRAILTLVRQLRNTIHGASYGAFGTAGSGEPSSFVRVAQHDATTLLEAVTALGDLGACGFTQRYGDLCFEPYSFVDRLTEDVLKLIAALAAATDVTRFFKGPIPAEFINPPRRPGHHNLFDSETLADVDLLG